MFQSGISAHRCWTWPRFFYRTTDWHQLGSTIIRWLLGFKQNDSRHSHVKLNSVLCAPAGAMTVCPPSHGHVYWATFNMPEHLPPVERQTDWQVIRLPERRNYIQDDALLCRSTNTWQAAPAADLSTGKNTRGDGSYRLTFYCNVDLRCSTWVRLRWSASVSPGLMNKGAPKRRRIWSKSPDWGAAARLWSFTMDFSPDLNVK